jgi:hypothetical protein
VRRREPGARSATALATAIADAERIDWDRATTRADSSTRGLIANLRTVAQVGLAAQSAGNPADSALATASRSAESGTANLDSGGRGISWRARGLAAVATAQILAGAVGWVLGAGQNNPTAAVFPVLVFVTLSATSAWLILGGRHDRRAVNLAVLYLLIASAFARRFLVVLAPTPLWLYATAPCVDTFLPVFLWRFVREFPHVAHFSRADTICRAAERVSWLVSVLLFTANLALALTPTPAWLAVFGRSNDSGLYWAALVFLLLPAMPLAWVRARLASPHERRRLGLFTTGLAVGLVPPLLVMASELLVPSVAQAMASGMRRRLAPVFYGLFLLVPLVTAYAVVVDRVLDVRTAMGRAFQYLLARTTLKLLTFAPVIVFAAYAYTHRATTLGDLIAGWGGIVSIGFATVAASVWLVRDHAVKYVDRLFLRTETEASEALPQLAAALRHTRSRAEFAQLLQLELRRHLHVTHAALLLRDTANAFVAVGRGTSSLEADRALSVLLEADRNPLVVAPEAPESLFALLPAAERDWLTMTDTAVLVPLVGTNDTRLGVIGVGAKRNAVPFARSELSFMAALASSVALVLEMESTRGSDSSWASETADDEPAEQCAVCGRVSAPDRGEAACACGGAWQTASLPVNVAGKYRVERLVGAGSMGIVYLARDTALDRAVALKTLPRLAGDAAERLAREARVMASVIHPNLATIFALEQWRGTPILVAEYLDGGNLAARLRRGPQSIGDIVRLGLLLVPALEQLHGAHILHRDVKPSNIAFSRSGIPKLLDFGLATLTATADRAPLPSPGLDVPNAAQGPASWPGTRSSEATATQAFVVGTRRVAGTPLYLSPEAAAGAEEHPDFDVWGLTITLYEAIAGQHPLVAPSVDTVLRKVKRAVVPDLRDYRSDCPGPVAEAFAAALARDRARRPRSARDLGRLLAELA